MDISDDEPPHDDAADDDDGGAAEAIEVSSSWDPETKVMRYRAYVAGATAPLNYKGYASTAEEFEEKKAKRYALAVKEWRRLSAGSTESASSSCASRGRFSSMDTYTLRDKRQQPQRKMAGGGVSLRWTPKPPPSHLSRCLTCGAGGDGLVECSKCPRAFCDACCTVGATGCLVCDDCAVKTHVSYCYKCDDEAHIQCSNCPRACCGECSAEGARGGFVCDECGFKECLQGSLGPLFEKLNIEAQTAGSPDDFMRLIRLATAALDAQMSELAELERIVSHGRGFTAKKQQGLALLRLLQNGGEPGDAGGPLLSAVQISRLKKELVEHIFAWGHGNVAQTKLLLEAVFNDELVRFVVPRFAADDGGGLRAQEIVKGIRDFVTTRKLPSVGGTYVTEKYIDLETIALATAASGGGPDVGVPASFLRRHEELLADVRRGPRQRRKDKLNTTIIAEFWHDSRVSRIDTFSKGLSSTPDCSLRSTALVSNKEAYNLFLKSPGLLEARARLKELGHKHYDKAFSYSTFIKFKCACIMQPQLRSCVCQKCQQMEYYFLAGCDYYVRRAKAQALKFSNLTLFGKARWLAPIRAFVCAAHAHRDAVQTVRVAHAAWETLRIAYERFQKQLDNI